jgi:uncharacterized protein YlxP (DUF503 family)
MTARIGILTLTLECGTASTLKEKRSLIRPFSIRSRQAYNFSIAETGHQDSPRQTEFTFVRACDDVKVIQADFSSFLNWCESHFPELPILSQHLEII